MKKIDDFLKESVSDKHKKNVLDMARSQLKSEKSFFEKYRLFFAISTTAVVALVLVNSFKSNTTKDFNLMEFNSTFAADDLTLLNEIDDYELIEILDELESWEEG